jgi:large subunit ribosomal protein L28
MPRRCEVCGKHPTFGNTVARRGRAKYLGGVGIKTTGISRRKFDVNLQKVRTKTANGTVKRITLCAQCIQAGAVTKPPRRPKLEKKPAEAAAK